MKQRLVIKVLLYLQLIIATFLFSGCDVGFYDSRVDINKLDKKTLLWHLQEILDVDGLQGDEFVRWERPIRYYLQGLENHPEIEALFLEKLKEMTALTGLDIQPHTALFLNDPDPKKAKVGSDGLHTNVVIIFAEDIEKAFKTPGIKNVVNCQGLGDSQDDWDSLGEYFGEDSYKDCYQFNKSGLTFYSQLRPISAMNKGDTLQEKYQILFLVLKMIAMIDRESDAIFSIYNKNSIANGTTSLTPFDKVFFKTYYSDRVKSGIMRQEAAVKIADSIAGELSLRD